MDSGRTLPRPPSALRRGKTRSASIQPNRVGHSTLGCSSPQASPRRRQKIIGNRRQPQPSDQRLSTDDWLLRMAPNRKMTSSHRMTPSSYARLRLPKP
ncbi:hypothetical protein V8C37DRAFT_386551 [Trichoderma ceciliae]